VEAIALLHHADLFVGIDFRPAEPRRSGWYSELRKFGVNPVLSYSKFIDPAHSATYSAELRNSRPDRKIVPRGSFGDQPNGPDLNAG